VSPSNAHCSAHLLLADNSALGVRLGEELRLVSVRCRVTREETSKLQAPWDLGVRPESRRLPEWVAAGFSVRAIPGQLEQPTKDGAFFGGMYCVVGSDIAL
jgi:hypothetical protein